MLLAVQLTRCLRTLRRFKRTSLGCSSRRTLAAAVAFLTATLAVLTISQQFGTPVAPQTAVFRRDHVSSPAASSTPPVLSIPRLVHFTARSERLRVDYRPIIEHWLATQRGLRFYLWRDTDAECLARLQYPGSRIAAALMEGTQTSLERSDLARVLVLHSMGGFYADLDTEPLRDLGHLFDRPLAGAMIATEPQEHATLLFGLDSLVSNAAMFSAPGHPFFAAYANAIAANLLGHRGASASSGRRRARFRDNFAAPEITGPLAMQRVLEWYQQSREVHNCSNPGCRVHLFEPAVFSPHFDAAQTMSFRINCLPPARRRDPRVRLVCDELAARNFQQARLTNATLAVHQFRHMTTHRGPAGGYFNASLEFPQLEFFANEGNC